MFINHLNDHLLCKCAACASNSEMYLLRATKLIELNLDRPRFVISSDVVLTPQSHPHRNRFYSRQVMTGRGHTGLGSYAPWWLIKGFGPTSQSLRISKGWGLAAGSYNRNHPALFEYLRGISKYLSTGRHHHLIRR